MVSSRGDTERRERHLVMRPPEDKRAERLGVACWRGVLTLDGWRRTRGTSVADVFISYAREDRETAARLAEAFQQEGLTVWWDREIGAGAEFRKLIERELEAARCVVVAWSKASRESSFVADEASWADERKALVPVWIEKVRAPLGFGQLHTEDLTGWSGDRQAEPWRRVMLQVQALTGAVIAEPSATDAAPSAPAPTPSTSKARMDLSGVLPGALLLAGVAALASNAVGGPFQLGALGTILVSAALAFLMFRWADGDLSPAMKAMAARWFLPVDGGVRVSVTEGFNNLFEAVFGRRHFSFFCLWRSALSSTIGFALVFCIVVYGTSFGEPARAEVAQMLANPFADIMAVGVVPAFLVVNILGDYVSLYETRLILRAVKSSPVLLFPLIVVDAVVSLFVFALASYVVVWGTDIVLSGGQVRMNPIAYFQVVYAPLHQRDFDAALWRGVSVGDHQRARQCRDRLHHLGVVVADTAVRAHRPRAGVEPRQRPDGCWAHLRRGGEALYGARICRRASHCSGRHRCVGRRRGCERADDQLGHSAARSVLMRPRRPPWRRAAMSAPVFRWPRTPHWRPPARWGACLARRRRRCGRRC